MTIGQLFVAAAGFIVLRGLLAYARLDTVYPANKRELYLIAEIVTAASTTIGFCVLVAAFVALMHGTGRLNRLLLLFMSLVLIVLIDLLSREILVFVFNTFFRAA